MRVKLLSHTPNPDRVVAASAKLCYSKSNAVELFNGMSTAQVYSLVRKVGDMGHLSTFEHVSFTFGVDGVSRTLTHQLVRHRIASYSQQSQRYVDSTNKEYIIPHTIYENAEALDIFNDIMNDIVDAYDALSKLGIPKEDARYVLSNATETKIIITMNARELLHFFGKRCCSRAQWEIREMANAMLACVHDVSPLLFDKAGPHCISDGICPEGAMSCGRISSNK